jgi:hypothetical protein
LLLDSFKARDQLIRHHFPPGISRGISGPDVIFHPKSTCSYPGGASELGVAVRQIKIRPAGQ